MFHLRSNQWYKSDSLEHLNYKEGNNRYKIKSPFPVAQKIQTKKIQPDFIR